MKQTSSSKRAMAPSNRRVVSGFTGVVAALVIGRGAFANAQKPEPDKRTALHQEIEYDASPSRVYEILLGSKPFAAFTGMPADIDAKPGGAFSMFGGMIRGRNVELVPNARIVQAWRPGSWHSGVYSIVKFELKPHGTGTTVILDHSSFPEGDFESLDSGWHERYWAPLKKYLAKG